MVAKSIRFNKKKIGIPGVFWTWSLIGVVLVASVLFVAHNIRLYQKRAELQDNVQNLKVQVATLLERKSDLNSGIAESTTQEYQEKVLREQGLYKKPGEEVVTIVSAEGVEENVKEKKEWIWWNPLTWVEW